MATTREADRSIDTSHHVSGNYYGHEFSGEVTNIWPGWASDSLFVKLDRPIVVHGEERTSISVPNPGKFCEVHKS